MAATVYSSAPLQQSNTAPLHQTSEDHMLGLHEKSSLAPVDRSNVPAGMSDDEFNRQILDRMRREEIHRQILGQAVDLPLEQDLSTLEPFKVVVEKVNPLQSLSPQTPADADGFDCGSAWPPIDKYLVKPVPEPSVDAPAPGQTIDKSSTTIVGLELGGASEIECRQHRSSESARSTQQAKSAKTHINPATSGKQDFSDARTFEHGDVALSSPCLLPENARSSLQAYQANQSVTEDAPGPADSSVPVSTGTQVASLSDKTQSLPHTHPDASMLDNSMSVSQPHSGRLDGAVDSLESVGAPIKTDITVHIRDARETPATAPGSSRESRREAGSHSLGLQGAVPKSPALSPSRVSVLAGIRSARTKKSIPCRTPTRPPLFESFLTQFQCKMYQTTQQLYKMSDPAGNPDHRYICLQHLRITLGNAIGITSSHRF